MECKNCAFLLKEDDTYCNSCGAKVIRNRLTLKNLWAEFIEKFFNIENTLVKTYITLFKKPEDVIHGYVSGIRKRYINVINYFALAVTISGIQLFILLKWFKDRMDISPLVANSTPDGFVNVDWMYDYYSLVVLINLPIYAFIAYLVFYTLKKYNFTEHFVAMTYISAQYSITTAFITLTTSVIGFNFYIVGSILNIFLMIYTAYCYKRIFKLSTGDILIRTLLFIGIAMVFLIIYSVLQIGVMILTGDFQEMIEAEKAKRGVTYIASSVMNWTS
ncbi:MAG: DUF3667 domain-containing protein [Flavobacteriaceae bacterium]|nr:DUF3667 domain-containing protein [Flavobacteriaceae bacterium]